jgi:hypothetical protein
MMTREFIAKLFNVNVFIQVNNKRKKFLNERITQTRAGTLTDLVLLPLSLKLGKGAKHVTVLLAIQCERVFPFVQNTGMNDPPAVFLLEKRLKIPTRILLAK